MKLVLHQAWKEKENRILLVRKEELPEALFGDPGEREYVRNRLQSEKGLALLNHLDHVVIVKGLALMEAPIHTKLENARKSGYELLSVVNDFDLEAVVIENGGIEPQEFLAFAEGLALSCYQFLKYRTGKKDHSTPLQQIALVDPALTATQVEEMNRVLKAVYLARDLVNEPLSYLTAVQLSSEIENMGKEAGFDVEVFNKKKIESLKMGGLLAVNKGSVDPPTFSILTWKPDDAVNQHPIVLVGKGVVYDTGGLSLKPTLDSMDYMKCDMGGAAAVAGILYAVSANRLPVWVVGLVPSTDNRPDGNAYVPGDVVTMYDGTTVEVLNTDAEGRMLLADALSYARKYDPELVIDLATLTGSAHMAIDKFGIVGMGNAGREVMELLKESGERTSERIAEFPFWEEYAESLKSDIADLKNIGGKYAGAITAGKFLEHFTDYPYIHLDIAGPAFNKALFNYRGKGGSGVGVRILYDFLYHRSH
jgi:leucyl aminopeptidase